MPGFVNCHTHIASNMLLRGLLEDVQLFEWLSTMWQLKRNFDPDTLYWASLAGLAEMAKAGITTFNEHFDAYAVEPEIEALQRIPLRATLGYGFADRGIYASITDWSWKTLENFGDLVKKHHRSGGERVHLALSPHAPYSCGADMFRLVREVADAEKVAIHTHLAEGPQEVAYVADTYGTTPVKWVHSLGFLGPDVTAAHCTQLTDDDIAIMAETGTHIGHCPCCNAKLNSGTARLRDIRAAGVSVGLATDGPASHNTLDMFQEMKFAGMIHKDKTDDVEFLKTNELLEMATAGSAAAMNRPETGALAPGKKADVIVVDLDRLHCLPVYDEAAALVYSARADDVVTTIADGRIVMEDRVLAGVDEAEIRAKFREKALALRDRSL
jgi:5-methylthioadenosine/S-adenosylhomocysteine deaminase